MKYVAVTAYAVLTLASGIWMVSSFIGNRNADFSWRPDELAFTFILMTLFAVSVLVLQLNRPMSWWLVGQTALVGVPLLIAALYHMFPEKSVIAASVHLIFAVLFIVLNAVTCLRPVAQ